MTTTQKIVNLINALESGKYIKGKGRLKAQKGPGLCCLGVEAKINRNMTDKILSVEPNHSNIGIYSKQKHDFGYDFVEGLMTLNDNSIGWKKVIEKLKNEVNNICVSQKKRKLYP